MDGYIRIGTEIDNSNFDAEINYIEGKMKDIEDKLKQADMGFEVGDTQKLEAQYSKLSKQLSKLVAKQKEMNQTDLSQLQGSIDKVGNSVNKAVSKVGKWALAVFGVRSAYMFVRQAMGTLSQYDDQMAINVQYISYLLASILKPIIETIIQLAYKLLTYINYIAQAWFGVNLFANASTKAFEKQNKALGKSTKQAKELKKQLAGFDEMNVLQDNGDVSSAGGGAGATMPNFPKMEDVPIPSWVQWIADNKDMLIAAIAGITAGLIALKLGLQGIQALGIGIIVAGVVMLIQDVIKFIKDPSWKNFVNILGDIAIVIGGIMLVMGNWWGLLVVIVGLAVKLIADNWDTISAILGKIGEWIYNNVLMPAWNFIKSVGETIWSFIKLKISLLQALFTTVIGIITNPFIVAKDTIMGIFNGIKTFFQGFVQVIRSLFNGDIRGILNGFKSMFSGIVNSLVSVAKAPLNLIIGALNTFIKGINKISFDVPKWVPVIGGKKFGFNLKQIPRLAKGGIVNMPGRGINYGGANIAEKGAEGIIPLTDSQQMALLGEAIGKYININATVPVYVGNRQIAREIKRINAESDFAFNR